MSKHVSLDDWNHVLYTGWGPPHSSSHQGKSCCCSYNVSECQKVSFPIAMHHQILRTIQKFGSRNQVLSISHQISVSVEKFGSQYYCGEICCKCKSSFGQSWTSPPVIAQMSWDLQPQSGKLRVNIIWRGRFLSFLRLKKVINGWLRCMFTGIRI